MANLLQKIKWRDDLKTRMTTDRRLKICGIDPGSRLCGFGVLEVHPNRNLQATSFGVIELSPQASLAQRLGELQIALSELLRKHQPDIVVVEKIFLGKSADSAFKLGHARGVVIAAAQLSGAQITEYATRQVKKSVAGNGGAEKQDVCQAVKNILRLKNLDSLDASDALALAIHQASLSALSFEHLKENIL